MMQALRIVLPLACYLLLAAPAPARADLPAFLRIENRHVRNGNDKLAKGDAKGALSSYDTAARELPNAPGVQLDRGLALLKLGELDKSREALLAAAAPSAPKEVRADAYRNLALSYYRQADTLAGQNDHGQAQQLFREALDASKRALRLAPGDPSTAWNLELAARRMREEEQKHKAEQEKQQQDPNQDQQNQDQQNQDQQNQDQQSQDQQNQDQQNQDQQNQDQQGQDQDQTKPDDAQSEAKQPPKPDANANPPDEPKPKAPEPQPAEAAQDPSAKPLPADVAQALDSLEDGEENFERMRARQRAARERRAPAKDW